MAVLLDTGFYLGLVHPADENALRAGEILKELSTGKYGLLYSTNLVFSEVTTLVYIRTNGNKGVLNDLEELLWGEDKIVIQLFTNTEYEKKTWKLFKKINENIKSKRNFMSFVDTSLLVHAKESNIDYIASFDEEFENHIARLF
ncbi:MAG: hypothetical protein HeimC3_48000 [Candidatus Heimdallarchaeota archaeon LC_3]|nr:MAG: hypothetical protein HeimC3_48000 [Candidatus Heimdallarchaeota archaeon LC_3]